MDLEETCRRDIPVCAIGEYCTQEVAEHTMAMLLALDRNLRVYARTVDKERRWQYYAAPTPMGLHGSTLGLFGFGKIGRAVAQRARAFGMRVLASDIHADPAQAKKLGVELADADTLLRESDVISNHMNLTPENTHYFSDARFRQMAKHPIFLNAARGGSVDEAALIRALDSGAHPCTGQRRSSVHWTAVSFVPSAWTYWKPRSRTLPTAVCSGGRT